MKRIFRLRLALGVAIFSLTLATAGRMQVPYAGVTTLMMGLDASNGIIPAAPVRRVQITGFVIGGTALVEAYEFTTGPQPAVTPVTPVVPPRPSGSGG